MLYQLEVRKEHKWKVIGRGDFESPREAIDTATKECDYPVNQIRVKVYNEDDHNWDEYPQCPLCWEFVFKEKDGYQCDACGWAGIFASQSYVIKVKNPDGEIKWVSMSSEFPMSPDAITTAINEEYPGYSILEIQTD